MADAALSVARHGAQRAREVDVRLAHCERPAAFRVHGRQSRPRPVPARVRRVSVLAARHRDALLLRLGRLPHEVLKMRAVLELRLRRVAARYHRAHRVSRVHAAQRLGAEHDAVGAVEHGIRNVGRLGARRPRRAHHGVHDARHDAGLAEEVAARGDVLLNDRDLLWQAVEAEVAAREHDAVRRVEDAAEARQRRLGVELRNHVARV